MVESQCVCFDLEAAAANLIQWLDHQLGPLGDVCQGGVAGPFVLVAMRWPFIVENLEKHESEVWKVSVKFNAFDRKVGFKWAKAIIVITAET